jgi:membrane protein implicated in regulation of membrane protease activity
MWILAIGWMYVVTLMAATEPSVVAGIMTFLFYGLLPLSLVLYLTGAWRRGRARKQKDPHSKRGDTPTT